MNFFSSLMQGAAGNSFGCFEQSLVVLWICPWFGGRRHIHNSTKSSCWRLALTHRSHAIHKPSVDFVIPGHFFRSVKGMLPATAHAQHSKTGCTAMSLKGYFAQLNVRLTAIITLHQAKYGSQYFHIHKTVSSQVTVGIFFFLHLHFGLDLLLWGRLIISVLKLRLAILKVASLCFRWSFTVLISLKLTFTSSLTRSSHIQTNKSKKYYTQAQRLEEEYSQYGGLCHTW